MGDRSVTVPPIPTGRPHWPARALRHHHPRQGSLRM